MAFRRSVTSDTLRKLHIAGHDRYALRMNGAKVRILEDPDEVRFRCFLQSLNRPACEFQIGSEICCDLSDEALEGQLPEQKIR